MKIVDGGITHIMKVIVLEVKLDVAKMVIDSSKYAVPDPSNPSSPTGAPDTTQSPSDDTFPWWVVAGAAAGVGAVVLGGATLIVGAVIGVVTAFVGFLTHLFWGW